MSAWHIRMRLVAGAATLFDSVDTLSIAYALPVLTAVWRLSPQMAGLVVAAGYVGQLLGGVFFGWLAERIGRVATIRYTVAIYALFSLFCAVSWNYGSLLAFRSLQGLGLGGEVPVAAVYINEFAKAKTRGRFFLLYEQTYSAGRLVAGLLGVWVVAHFGWRYMFLIGAAPAILAMASRRWLPESPRWLAAQGRMAEADIALRQIEGTISRPSGKTFAAGKLPRVEAERPAASVDWKELFRDPYRARTLRTWLIWFAAFLLLNGLTNWVPTLYTTVYRVPLQTALVYGLVSSIAAYLGGLVSAIFIERVGRRRWYILAFSVTASASVGLWLWGAFSGSHQPGARALVVLVSIIVFCANSIAMVAMLHTPEIYPTRMRAFATSMACVWLRAASIIAPLFIGFTVARSSLATLFLVFGLTAWLAAFVARFSVETTGRTLEEIAA